MSIEAIDEWNSESVQAIIARVEVTRDIDHLLTRLGIGGLVCWTDRVDDEHLYMDEGQREEALDMLAHLDSESRADLEEIADLYHKLLKSKGR